jgi:hypothetical protein
MLPEKTYTQEFKKFFDDLEEQMDATPKHKYWNDPVIK